MQVKVCPNCGVENALNYAVCRRCQTSLAAAVPVESQMLTVGPPPPGQRQSYPNTQPQPSQPPPTEEPAESPLIELPPRRSSSIFVTLFRLILLAAVCVGGYYGWQKLNAPKPRPTIPADQVVMAFLQAKGTGNIEQVKPYLSKSSHNILDKRLSDRQAESAGITREDVSHMYLWGIEPTKEQLKGATIKAVVIDDKGVGKNSARVRATVNIISGALGPETGEYDYILVIEDGAWKIDLNKTSEEGTGGGMNPVMH